MLTIKAISIAAIALVGTTAAVTYAATTVFIGNDAAEATADLNACNAVLAKLQASQTKTEEQEEAAKKYFHNEPWVLDRGRKF